MSTPESGLLPEDHAQTFLRRTHDCSQKNFARQEPGRAWLATQGITNLSLADVFKLGWSDGQLPSILPKDPAVTGGLTALGVLTPKGKERLAQCLVVPVFSADGRIANLVGLSSSGTPKSLPGRPLPPWNLTAAKTSPALWLAPSILDGLAVAMAGHANVIALDPVAGEFDPAPLQKAGVQRITVVQGDTPEALATTKALQAKLAGYSAGVVTLNGVAGASALLRAKGAKALGEALAADAHGVTSLSIPGMQPLPGGLTLVIGTRRYEVRGLQAGPSRLKVTVRAERGGKPPHVDTLDLYRARDRRQLMVDLIRHHGESADVIDADLAKLLAACELRAVPPDLVERSDAAEPMPEADRREAEAMGRDPRLFDMILADYEACGLIGEKNNKLLVYLVMSSRKMHRPLAVLILASSGSGKSALQDVTSLFCPPEELKSITNLSAKALYYQDPHSLRQNFLKLEETKGAEEASLPIRALISSGELTSEVATKDPTTGRLVSVRHRVEGPVAVSITTTNPNTDPETRSRFLMIATDESAEQTAAICEFQRHQQTLEGLLAEESRAAIYNRHHAFQRLLQPLRVINPLAHRLAGLSNRLTARRDQPKLLGVVNAVAFLRQLVKPIKQHGTISYIEVDEEDLKIAAGLIHALTGPGAQEVSRPARELLAILARMKKAARDGDATFTPGGEFTFTRREVREFASWERTRVHRYLAELLDLEYVVRDRSQRGTSDRYVLAWEDEQSFGPTDNVLPFDGLCRSEPVAIAGK